MARSVRVKRQFRVGHKFQYAAFKLIAHKAPGTKTPIALQYGVAGQPCQDKRLQTFILFAECVAFIFCFISISNLD